jgi:hypothetical protein
MGAKLVGDNKAYKTMEEWRKNILKPFAREYSPASGLRFDAWIEGEGG